MANVVCSLPSATFRGLGLLIGDSIAANLFGDATSKATLEAGNRLVANQAVSGETISQQLTRWDSNVLKTARECTWVILEVQINDIIAGTASATILSNLASFRSNITTANPYCRVVQTLPTPARAYSGMAAGDYTIWQAVVAGLSAVSETNVVVCPAIAELNDGSDNLAAAYNSGDGLHLNAAGSQLMATAWRAALDS
jgi:lysophospholipase L1-like esterase